MRYYYAIVTAVTVTGPGAADTKPESDTSKRGFVHEVWSAAMIESLIRSLNVTSLVAIAVWVMVITSDAAAPAA